MPQFRNKRFLEFCASAFQQEKGKAGMSSIENVSVDLGNGKALQIETGKMALLCNGR